MVLAVAARSPTPVGPGQADHGPTLWVTGHPFWPLALPNRGQARGLLAQPLALRWSGRSGPRAKRARTDPWTVYLLAPVSTVGKSRLVVVAVQGAPSYCDFVNV
jgi:hypothetical protein